MKPKYIIDDMFTGEPREVPDLFVPGEPTQWWINGWNAGMNGEPTVNPYPEHTTEWHEWNDGYAAAEED